MSHLAGSAVAGHEAQAEVAGVVEQVLLLRGTAAVPSWWIAVEGRSAEILEKGARHFLPATRGDGLSSLLGNDGGRSLVLGALDIVSSLLRG